MCGKIYIQYDIDMSVSSYQMIKCIGNSLRRWWKQNCNFACTFVNKEISLYIAHTLLTMYSLDPNERNTVATLGLSPGFNPIEYENKSIKV